VGIEKNSTPNRFAARQVAHDAPNNVAFDERRQRLAIGHVGGGTVFDTQRVPTAGLI
jgi:hypothetical protein